MFSANQAGNLLKCHQEHKGQASAMAPASPTPVLKPSTFTYQGLTFTLPSGQAISESDGNYYETINGAQIEVNPQIQTQTDSTTGETTPTLNLEIPEQKVSITRKRSLVGLPTAFHCLQSKSRQSMM